MANIKGLEQKLFLLKALQERGTDHIGKQAVVLELGKGGDDAFGQLGTQPRPRPGQFADGPHHRQAIGRVIVFVRG